MRSTYSCIQEICTSVAFCVFSTSCDILKRNIPFSLPHLWIVEIHHRQAFSWTHPCPHSRDREPSLTIGAFFLLTDSRSCLQRRFVIAKVMSNLDFECLIAVLQILHYCMRKGQIRQFCSIKPNRSVFAANPQSVSSSTLLSIILDRLQTVFAFILKNPVWSEAVYF